MLLHDGAHPVLTDDGGAILDERSGRWTQLTPTAAAAVTALLATDTAEQAAARYAARYRLSLADAHRDIKAVAHALRCAGLAAGLAQREPPARPRPRLLGRRWRRARWRRWRR